MDLHFEQLVWLYFSALLSGVNGRRWFLPRGQDREARRYARRLIRYVYLPAGGIEILR